MRVGIFVSQSKPTQLKGVDNNSSTAREQTRGGMLDEADFLVDQNGKSRGAAKTPKTNADKELLFFQTPPTRAHCNCHGERERERRRGILGFDCRASFFCFRILLYFQFSFAHHDRPWRWSCSQDIAVANSLHLQTAADAPDSVDLAV